MRKNERSAFKAGLFIIASMILGLGIIISIKGLRSVFTPVVERKVRFGLTDDIGGLRMGDDVRLGGFKIGVIRSIDVLGIEDGQKPEILVGFTAPEKYSLHQNAHIAVQGTLTGSTWLNIDDLGSGTLLSATDELVGHPSATGELLADLSKTTPELRALVHDVRTITVPGVNSAVAKCNTMIDSIHSFADRAVEVAAQLRDLLGDTTTDIRGTLASINKIAADAKAKLPALLDHADAAIVKISDTIDNAKGTLEDLRVAVANTKELTGSAKSIIVSNRGKLDGIIAGLKTTSDNLKAASVEVHRSPWRLLYKPAPDEMANLTLFDAARQFADGANTMNDAAESLRDASRDSNADPEQIKLLIQKLDDSFTHFKEVEKKLWEAVK